jgi:hypothetical protein
MPVLLPSPACSIDQRETGGLEPHDGPHTRAAMLPWPPSHSIALLTALRAPPRRFYRLL